MEIPAYIQNNKKELTFLLIILLAKSVVQLFAFPGSFWLTGIRILLFLIAFVLSLIIIDQWKYKFLTLALIILFSVAQGQLKLWRIPAMVYIYELNQKYEKPIEYILSHDSIKEIHCDREEGLILAQGAHYTIDVSNLSDTDEALLTAFLKDTEVIEIEKDKYCTLFVLNRFIDNGSGLLYATPENINHIKNEKNYRINWLDITGCTKIWGNWYYISFT